MHFVLFFRRQKTKMDMYSGGKFACEEFMGHGDRCCSHGAGAGCLPAFNRRIIPYPGHGPFARACMHGVDTCHIPSQKKGGLPIAHTHDTGTPIGWYPTSPVKEDCFCERNKLGGRLQDMTQGWFFPPSLLTSAWANISSPLGCLQTPHNSGAKNRWGWVQPFVELSTSEMPCMH